MNKNNPLYLLSKYTKRITQIIKSQSVKQHWKKEKKKQSQHIDNHSTINGPDS